MTQPNEVTNDELTHVDELPDVMTADDLGVVIAEKRRAAFGPEEPTDDVEPVEPAVPAEEPEEPVDEEPEGPTDEETLEETDDEKAARLAEQEEELTEEEEFFLGRYKTREAAEAGLAEKDLMIDRLMKGLDKPEPEPDQGEPQLDVAAWHEWAEGQVEAGAGQAGAQAALERGGIEGFDIYVAHWLASDDPRERAQAAALNNQVQRAYAAQIARQEVQPALERDRAADAANDGVRARDAVRTRFTDFVEYEEEMDALIEEDNPTLPDETKIWLAELANSGLEGKQRAWEYLYHAAKATKAPRRRQASAEARRQQRASEDADKVAATVSSAEGTQVSTPLSADEVFAIRRKNAIRARNGMELLPEE